MGRSVYRMRPVAVKRRAWGGARTRDRLREDTVMQNTLIIGDIHGCHAELLDLLDRAAIGDGDLVVSVGDLVDRGPEPGEVVEERGVVQEHGGHRHPAQAVEGRRVGEQRGGAVPGRIRAAGHRRGVGPRIGGPALDERLLTERGHATQPLDTTRIVGAGLRGTPLTVWKAAPPCPPAPSTA